MMKRKNARFTFFIVALASIAAACVSSGDEGTEAESPTALPNPPATAMPTQVVNVPEAPTPTPELELTVLGSAEAPPTSGCVVYQEGRVTDEELPLVRSDPGAEFDVIGRFGRNRWATGVGAQGDWYEIVVGPSETGWVQAAGVGTNGQCDASQEVLIIMNRGAPANSRCVAMIPGTSTEMPAVYQAADTQSAIVARLGNWADVQEINPDWYSILLLDGGAGWVEEGKVELSMGCGTSGAIRIEFAAGETTATLDGKLPRNTQVEYLFGAAEGQWLEISVISPENSILFHVEGVQDGQVIKHLLDGESSWQGMIPFSQDYLLTLDNSGIVATYMIRISIQDEPETGP